MPNIWLSLGSNIDREKHILSALDELKNVFGKLTISRVYESEAVGFDGPSFHNLVVGIDTDLSVTELKRIFHAMEVSHGRVKGRDSFCSRTLDIDLLTYGDQQVDEAGVELPRDEITKYAFVLLPLSEVAGDERHPVIGKCYRELWESFDMTGQTLWPVEFRQDDR